MSKALWAILASVSLAGVAQAQDHFGDVKMSTDPAEAAAVEQHAAALRAQQAAHPSHGTVHAMHHHLRTAAHVTAPAKAATKAAHKS